MKLEKGQKFLLIGDSITDCDRAKPAGEGLFEALGKGYVSYIDALLQSIYPGLGIRTVNKGISGNTVRDLKGRWKEDVLDQEPDWLSIMIGTNDVWRQYDTPFIKEWHVYKDEYEATLEALVKDTRPLVKGLILMTPFYIELNENDAMRHTMDQYGAVVKRIAQEYDCILVDTQTAFNNVLNHLYSSTLSWDRVHPTPAGHMVLAKALLKELDFDWNRS